MDEVVLDQRNLNFREQLLDVELTVDREGRSALTGQVARLERLIRIEEQRFLAIFEAGIDADAVLGPRGLEAIFTERAGEVDVGDLLRGLAFDHSEDVQVS